VLALLLWDKQQQTETALKQADTERQTAEERRQIAEINFQRSSALLHNATFKRQLEWLYPHKLQPLENVNHEKLHALLQRFPDEPGPDPGDRLLTAQIHMELADILVSWRRRAEAVQAYQKAIALLRPLVKEFPQEVVFRDFLAHCLCHTAYQLGWMRCEATGSDDGEREYRQAIALYEGLRKQLQNFPWYRMQLWESWKDLGETQRRLGRYLQADKAFRKALALSQQLFDEFPRSPRVVNLVAHTHNVLAWNLVSRPDWQPHQAAEALRHAKKSIALEPTWHDWWHTLGVAHCRLGQAKEALAAIEKSRQLSPDHGPPNSFDRFFEAMAYHQLGDRKKARRCYEEGVHWMEQHLPDHPDLRRFRAEAAKMLGSGSRK
jgi:tetratricopeptide (TPR) repeat protein